MGKTAPFPCLFIKFFCRGAVFGGCLPYKLAEGLYFAGEVMDLDAYTGGFNLQIAWATGRLAGLSAAEKEEW